MIVYTFECSGRSCGFKNVVWVSPLLIENVWVWSRLFVEFATCDESFHGCEEVFIFTLLLGRHPIESPWIDNRISLYFSLIFVFILLFVLLSIRLADLLSAASPLRLPQPHSRDMASHSINVVLSYSRWQIRQVLHLVEVMLSKFWLAVLPESSCCCFRPQMIGGRPWKILFFRSQDDGFC